MKASQQTLKKIERVIRKVVEKCPSQLQDPLLTDLYFQVIQETGELLVFDDDDNEITRCVVDEWIGNTSDSFYDDIQPILQRVLEEQRPEIDKINLLRPYSFVLMGEDRETIADLYLVDDDTILISGDLMEGLEEDLNSFLKKIMEED